MCVTCSSDVDVVRSASTGKNMVFRASDELGCQDSNLEPSDPESDVLPIELQPNRRRRSVAIDVFRGARDDSRVLHT